MATPEWRQTIKQGFGRGKVSEEDMRAALRRARKPFGPDEAPWEGVGYDWLEGFRRQPDAQTRHFTLQLLLDAGVNPNGGAPSFDHLPKSVRNIKRHEFFKLMHAGKNGSEASHRIKLGIPYRGSDLQAGFYLPWLGRTAWVGRDLPDLPDLLEQWVIAGADPNFQPDASKEETDSSDFNRALNQAWSSWAPILATGRMDALEAVLKHVPEGSLPKDWGVAVASALLGASENHMDMGQVADCVSRFAQHFPPSELDRRVVFRLLHGKPGAAWIRDPDALAAWLVTPCARFDEMRPKAEEGREGFNPWNVVGRWGRYDTEVQFRLLKAIQVHPRWGNAQSLRDSQFNRQSRSSRDAPENSTVVDGWASAEDESWNKGLNKLLPSLLELADRWGVSVSSSFGQLLASKFHPPSDLATRWLAKQGHEWVTRGEEGKTPWHYAPSRSGIWDWLVDQNIDPKRRDTDGVPGMIAAAVHYLSRRNRSFYQKAQSVVEKWEPEDRSGVVQGLEWVAWETVQPKAGSDCLHVSAAQQLEAAWVLNEPKAVEAWAKRNQDFSWAQLDEKEQRHLLLRLASSVPDWRQPAGGNHLDKDSALARCLEVVRQSKGLEGLKPSAFKGWLGAIAAHQPTSIMELPCGMPEAWAWLENVPQSALENADRRQVIRLWWTALQTKRMVDSRDANPWELWPWDADTWKTLPEADKGALALGVFRFALQKKHETAGIFAALTPAWLELFHELLLEGQPQRLVEFASPKQKQILQRLVSGPLAHWANANRIPVPEFIRPVVSRLRCEGLDEAWDNSVVFKRPRF